MSRQDPIQVDYKRHLPNYVASSPPRKRKWQIEKPLHDEKEVDFLRCLQLYLLGMIVQLPMLSFALHMFDISSSPLMEIGVSIACGIGFLVLLRFLPYFGFFAEGIVSGIFLHGLIKLAIAAGYLSSLLFILTVLALCLFILILRNQNYAASPLSESDRNVLDSWKPIGGRK